MGYMGTKQLTNTSPATASVELVDLTTEVTDKLLGEGSITEANLDTSVADKLVPTPGAGSGDSLLVVSDSESGYELGAVGPGADGFVQLDGAGSLPAGVDGSDLVGVYTANTLGTGIWCTPPTVSGTTSGLKADGTLYNFTAADSVPVDPAASSLTYHWAISQGTLSATTGTSVDVSFGLAQQNSTVTLSVYTEDDIGNRSGTVEVDLGVDRLEAPSSLSLSLPSGFRNNVAEQCDINIGDDGGYPTFTYSWERNVDSAGWVTTGFSDPAIKNPTLTLSTGTTVQVRCTVTNIAGGNTATSGSLNIVYLPAGLSLTIPDPFNIDQAEQLDITVADDGGDSNLSYSWERNVDSAGWVTTGFSDPAIKNPTLTISSGTLLQIRCTVTNLSGSTPQLSTSITLIYVPSGLSLTLPTSFDDNVAEQVDVTVGDDGGDSNLTYSWERNLDGAGFVTTGFSDPAIKNPTLTLPAGDGVEVKCTVTNSSGSTSVSDTRGIIEAPSSLSLTLPGNLVIGTPGSVDVTVGNDGGDSNFTYSWERNVDSAGWVTTGFSDAAIKSPTLTLTAGANVQVRCTVANGSGSTTKESDGSVSIIAMAPDGDSDFLDTSTHDFDVGTTTATVVDSNTINVPGADPAQGSTESSNNGRGWNPVLASLGGGKIVSIVQNLDDSNKVYSYIGNISGASISWEAGTRIGTLTGASISDIVVLDSTHVLVCMSASSDNYIVHAFIGTVGATSVSWDAGTSLTGTTNYNPKLTGVGTDKLVVVYQNGGFNMQSRVGTWNGSSISWETAAFVQSQIGSSFITTMGDDKVVWTNGWYVTVGTLSGVTMTWETRSQIQSLVNGHDHVAGLSDNTIVYTNHGSVGSNGSIWIGTYNGDGTFTLGAQSQIHGGRADKNKVIPLSDGTILFTGETGYSGWAIGTVNGTSITWDNSGQGGFNLCQTGLGLPDLNGYMLMSYASPNNKTIVFAPQGIVFAAGDVIQMPNGDFDVVAAVSDGAGDTKDVDLTSATAEAGTVYNVSSSYTVPQIAQQGGQGDFQEMALEVQWTRNKFTASESSGDVVLNHGAVEKKPFRSGDTILMSGDTDVVTTINGAPIHERNVSGEPTFGPQQPLSTTTTSALVYMSPGYVLYTAGGVGNAVSHVGAVSGNSITWGPEVVITTEPAYRPHCTQLSATKALFVCTHEGLSNVAYSYIGTLTGDVISWDSFEVIENTASSYVQVEKIKNTNKVICCYRNSGTTNMRGRIGTFDGSTVTWAASGYDVTMPATISLRMGMASFDTDMIAVGNVGYVSVGTITGTSISWSTAEQISTLQNWTNLTTPSTNVIVAVNGHGSIVSKVGTYSGGTITWGDEVSVFGSRTDLPELFSLDSNTVLYFADGAFKGWRIGTVSGNSITWGRHNTFSAGHTRSCFMEDTGNIVLYTRGGGYVGVRSASYITTITPTDTVPANLLTVDSLSIQLEGDLSSGTPSYQDLAESYTVVDSNTMKVTATLANDIGAYADIKVLSDNVDLNDVTVTRIEATFQA